MNLRPYIFFEVPVALKPKTIFLLFKFVQLIVFKPTLLTYLISFKLSNVFSLTQFEVVFSAHLLTCEMLLDKARLLVNYEPLFVKLILAFFIKIHF